MGKMSTTKAKHSQAPHPAIVSLPQFVQLYREWREIEYTGNFLNTYEGLKVIKKKYCFNNFRLNVRYFVCSWRKPLAGRRTITTGGSRVAR